MKKYILILTCFLTFSQFYGENSKIKSEINLDNKELYDEIDYCDNIYFAAVRVALEKYTSDLADAIGGRRYQVG